MPKEQSISVTDAHGHVHHFHGHYSHWVEGDWARFKKRAMLLTADGKFDAFIETGSIEFFRPIRVNID